MTALDLFLASQDPEASKVMKRLADIIQAEFGDVDLDVIREACSGLASMAATMKKEGSATPAG